MEDMQLTLSSVLFPLVKIRSIPKVAIHLWVHLLAPSRQPSLHWRHIRFPASAMHVLVGSIKLGP